MTAVFQRFSVAILVIILLRTPAESLLDMHDDFLGIVYRKKDESDKVMPI